MNHIQLSRAGMFDVRQSPINGNGLFAAKNICKGEVVIRWQNTRELSCEEYKNLSQDDLKFIDVQNGRVFLVGEPERFINHSCEANTIYGQFEGISCDIASRDILEGEEITSDYTQFCNPNRDFVCKCRANNCRGHIVAGQQSMTTY